MFADKSFIAGYNFYVLKNGSEDYVSYYNVEIGPVTDIIDATKFRLDENPEIIAQLVSGIYQPFLVRLEYHTGGI